VLGTPSWASRVFTAWCALPKPRNRNSACTSLLNGALKVHTFYSFVFADTHTWFRDSFARIGDLEHHVATQSAFWEDVMGGGRRYHGGEYRLQFHHANNAAAVMNAEGAARWMLHMRQALQVHAAELARCDVRVVPCILQVCTAGICLQFCFLGSSFRSQPVLNLFPPSSFACGCRSARAAAPRIALLL
jgi:truncated hemoglobin YjbI